MSDNEPENNGEEQIGADGRNATQRHIDEELATEGDAPVGVEIPRMREDRRMSEVIPEDPDRGGEEPVEEPTEGDEEETE
jgi:hypothetical protein